MSKLPVISGRECLRILGRAGFYLRRQEGSHMILRRDTPFAQVVSYRTTKNSTAER